MPCPLKPGRPGSRPPRPGSSHELATVRDANRCDFQTWVQMAPGGVQQAWTDILGMRHSWDLGLKSDFRLNRVFIVWVEVPMASFELR